jgi:hypothetical protein
MKEYYVVYKCTVEDKVVRIEAVLPLGSKYVELKNFICLEHFCYELERKIINNEDNSEELKEILKTNRIINL